MANGPFARTLGSLSAILAAAAAAQTPPDRVVAALCDPRRRPAAVAEAVAAGRHIMPALRNLLARAADSAQVDADSARAALLVTERLGASGSDAIPELIALVNGRDEIAVVAVACGLLNLLVPQVESDAGCRDRAGELRSSRPAAPRTAMAVDALANRLCMGSAPGEQFCLAWLGADEPVAWRSVCLAVAGNPQLATADVVAACEDRFVHALRARRGDTKWWAVADLAWLLSVHGSDTEPLLVARGLLWHDLAEAKLVGLERLRAVEELDRATILDVADLLDDGVRAVQELAAATLGGMGRGGLPGLPRLMRLGRDPAVDKRLRAVCARVTSQVLTATRARIGAGAARDMLERCVAMLAGEALPAAAAPADDAAKRVLADVAPALLHDEAGVAFLDDTLRTMGGGSRELAEDIVSVLRQAPSDTALPILALLMRIGAPADQIPDLDAGLAAAVAGNGSLYVSDAVEVLVAIAAGPDSTDEAVLAACRSEQPRRLLRGLTEAARRGLLAREEVRIAAVAGAAREEWPRQALSGGQRRLRCSQPLDEPLRAACALAAWAGGAAAPTAPIADHWVLDEGELAAWLQERRDPAALHATFVALEESVRRKLGVDRRLCAVAGEPRAR